MDYFWKENKKFVVAVAGGVLAVFLYHSFVLGPIRASAASSERSRTNERRELEAKMAQGVPAPDALALAKRDREQYQKALAAVSKEVVFKADDRFKKGERESAKAHYDNLRLEVEKQLKSKAGMAKVEFTGTLGLGEESQADQIPELLLRLAAAERLVSVAIEAGGVSKIEQVDAMAALSRDAAPGPGAFLNAYGVFMKFTGKSEAAFKIAHAVQKRGQYLAVTHFDLTREDVARDHCAASIGVAVLRVDEKAPIVPKPGAAP
jgi:hypothetical protein